MRTVRLLTALGIATTTLSSSDFSRDSSLVKSAARTSSSSGTTRRERLDKFRRPTQLPPLESNRSTPAREHLGKMLFFDPRLSGSGFLSCATCHNPSLDWQDGQPKALGNDMKRLGRRTPTILNAAWGESFFWDGRASTLEEQALGPIASPGEMNMPLEGLIDRLKTIDGYRPHFEAAYPGEGLTTAVVAKAIASFERTIVSIDAPFDRWVAGDERAVSAEAKRGFDVFTGKGRCSQCHSTWRFTDEGYYDIGVAGSDSGRARLVPGVEILEFAFKAPTLRNVDRRAPYLHDGSSPTLDSLIAFYDRGGDVKRRSLSPEIRPLDLTTGERRSLAAFLHTLTSVDAPVTAPRLPH
jgi:cytochrome c peroxidase